jgi:hypothetical protein
MIGSQAPIPRGDFRVRDALFAAAGPHAGRIAVRARRRTGGKRGGARLFATDASPRSWSTRPSDTWIRPTMSGRFHDVNIVAERRT